MQAQQNKEKINSEEESLEKEEIAKIVKEKKKPINFNEIFLALCTIALGIAHFLALKTTLFEGYIMDMGEIDLEVINWGVFNLTLMTRDLVLIGGTFLLGLLFLFILPKKPQEKEEIQIYIESDKDEEDSKNAEKE